MSLGASRGPNSIASPDRSKHASASTHTVASSFPLIEFSEIDLLGPAPGLEWRSPFGPRLVTTLNRPTRLDLRWTLAMMIDPPAHAMFVARDVGYTHPVHDCAPRSFRSLD